jgi:ribosome-associated protein
MATKKMAKVKAKTGKAANRGASKKPGKANRGATKKPGKPGKRTAGRGPKVSTARGRTPAPKRAARPKRPASAAAVALAGPEPVKAAPVKAAAPAPVDPARPTALALAHAGLDKKAEDVTVLDVRGLTSYADYFVVMTADSDRQASAIADHLEQTMKQAGVTKVGVEGYETGRWILVDYGDVVAHVMNRESRGFYDLEGLWADAPRFSVDA